MIDLSWKIAAKNIFRNTRRSLATGIAMTAGFVGLTLLGGYIYRVQRALEANTVYIQNLGHLSIYKKDGLENFFVKPSKYILTLEDQAKIAEVLSPFDSDIEYRSGFLSAMGLISNGDRSVPFIATGVSAETDRFVKNHPFTKTWASDFVPKTEGESFEVAVAKDPSAISITRSLGELIGRIPPFNNLNEDEKTVQLAARNLDGDLNAVNATLTLKHTTGIELMESTSLFAPLKLLQELMNTDGVAYLALYLKDSANRSGLLKKISHEFESKNLPFEIFPFSDEKVSSLYVGSLSFLYVMASFFVFLISGAVALSIVNSMTMGILERTKEIGTLRAIGYQPPHICGLFVKEAVLLTGFCVFFGSVLGLIISIVINSLNIRFHPPGISGDIQFMLIPNLWIMCAIASLFALITVVTSYFVVKSKTNRKIVDLLTDSGA